MCVLVHGGAALSHVPGPLMIGTIQIPAYNQELSMTENGLAAFSSIEAGDSEDIA
jgi:hypothetical protein